MKIEAQTEHNLTEHFTCSEHSLTEHVTFLLVIH